MKAKKLDSVCEFLAKYVRKLHSDHHLKNVLSTEHGTIFLDLIGPSDVSYIITLIKNSHLVWLQPPQSEEDAAQEKKKRLKPIFTAGEGKKRVFGETTWSKTGKQYYEYGKANWRACFNPKHQDYKILRSSWDKWISTKAKSMVLGSWTRKSIHSVLATREATNESECKGKRKSHDVENINNEDSDDEEEIEYGSDKDDHPLITVCSAWQKSSVGSSTNTGGKGSNAVSDVSKDSSITTTKPWTSRKLEMEDMEEEDDEEVANHDGEDLDKIDNDIDSELKLAAQDDPGGRGLKNKKRGLNDAENEVKLPAKKMNTRRGKK